MGFTKAAAAIGIAMALLWSGVSFAGPGGHGGKWKEKHGKRHGERYENMMKDMEALGLSEAQRAQLKTLHEAHKTEMETSRSSMRATHIEFRNAMQAGDKSDAELTTLHEKVVQVNSDDMRQRFKHMLQVRQILTAEQRTKFRGMMRPEPEDK